MLGAIAKKLFGTANDRIVSKFNNIVNEINQLESEFQAISDDELKSQTDKFRAELKNGKTLDDILPRAFATVREASRRVLNMRHFDVQLLGGIILHKGMITEMKTGEGKTLVATLPAYLNALEGKGVHVVSVNDYLVQRDSEWMGQIYKFLGLSIGCITGGMFDIDRKKAYEADITYGTNNEFGFDYLRDNMKFSLEEMVGREFNYAIIDEVDSILIDEARTPLIISGPAEDSSELYIKIDKLIPSLKETEDFEKEEKSSSIMLTDNGIEKVEEKLKEIGLLEEDSNLYDIGSISLVHHVNQALRAHNMFTRDVDYIVKDNKVTIIDEFTGRMMEGRRYSEGLHQALEAKEDVPIQNENQTLASITFQNYFRMYPKLSGMTGTAMTEAGEFSDIYSLEVVEVPTNIPVARIDENDAIYRTIKEKNDAIVELISEAHKNKQPMLVGTISIEKSEEISALLKKNKIPHNVLNARHHEKEAYIIAQAGRVGAVTIATNMAGRGTDIKLGGNLEMLIEEETSSIKDEEKRQKAIEKITAKFEEEKRIVKEAGGLFVLATERHESRRIDNQLRGRSGRQGDEGRTKFFLSLEDDLMRIFGTDKVSGLLQKIGFEEGESIDHPWINRALEKAQGKVEARNYEIRKNLLKFDNVMNDQRKVIFEQRRELMHADSVSETIEDMRQEITESLVIENVPAKAYSEQWDIDSLEKETYKIYGIKPDIRGWAESEGVDDKEILANLEKEVEELMNKKKETYGEEIITLAEKKILLLTLDELWKDHLLSLDHLKQGIYLRAYGQKDPLNEYKKEAFHMFESLLLQLRETVVTRLAHLAFSVENIDEEKINNAGNKKLDHIKETRIDPASANTGNIEQIDNHIPVANKIVAPEDRIPSDPSTWGKVGRNELCPCGSGKKYKYCHGKL